jgi:hypothetical protein
MNFKSKFSIYFFVVSSFLILSSCQKVINIDLNSTSPQIVIEGTVSDRPGPYTVKLSKTVNFSETNIFPAVTGASVIITGTDGSSETLKEAMPGMYITNALQGKPGEAYTISVNDNGKNYEAVSNLPGPVVIDTLIEKNTTFMGGKNKSVTLRFKDPAGIANYYRIMEWINGVEIKTISITSDRLRDGEVIELGLRGDPDSDVQLKTGDVVRADLQSIDKNVYEYFRTFNEASGGGNFNSSSPANPLSNLSNGALGYFSAYASTSESITIQ